MYYMYIYITYVYYIHYSRASASKNLPISQLHLCHSISSSNRRDSPPLQTLPMLVSIKDKSSLFKM